MQKICGRWFESRQSHFILHPFFAPSLARRLGCRPCRRRRLARVGDYSDHCVPLRQRVYFLSEAKEGASEMSAGTRVSLYDEEVLIVLAQRHREAATLIPYSCKGAGKL